MIRRGGINNYELRIEVTQLVNFQSKDHHQTPSLVRKGQGEVSKFKRLQGMQNKS